MITITFEGGDITHSTPGEVVDTLHSVGALGARVTLKDVKRILAERHRSNTTRAGDLFSWMVNSPASGLTVWCEVCQAAVRCHHALSKKHVVVQDVLAHRIDPKAKKLTATKKDYVFLCESLERGKTRSKG